MKDALDVKDVACHPGDEMLFMALKTQAVMLGFGGPMANPPKERFNVDLKDGEDVVVGSIRMRVIHTPGHTPGSCCFYLEPQKMLLSGDTLFRGSVGRSDFPGGSASALRRSVGRLLKMPGDTYVITGHDQFTTIEYESRNNVFARGGYDDY